MLHCLIDCLGAIGKDDASVGYRSTGRCGLVGVVSRLGKGSRARTLE